MENWKEFEKNTIKLIFEQLKDLGFELDLNIATDKNVQIIISELPLLGNKKKQLNLEMCFLPIEETNRNAMKYNYMQFFVAIQNDIEITIQKDLIDIVNTLNATLPIGTLGVLSTDQLLYFRYCAVLTQNMTEKSIKSMVDANVAMIITALNALIDMLSDIADGKLKKDEFSGINTDNPTGVN